MFKCFVCWKNVMLEISVCQNIVCWNVGYTEIMLYFNICMSYWCMFDYWCVQMVYTEILVFQNRVISKNVYEIVHVCPPHTARENPEISTVFTLYSISKMFRDSVNSTITNVAFADSMAVAGLVDSFLFLLFPPVVCTLHNARCENLINFPVTSISRKNYFANIRGSKAVLFKFLYLFKKKPGLVTLVHHPILWVNVILLWKIYWRTFLGNLACLK